jgi:hypothetical protein
MARAGQMVGLQRQESARSNSSTMLDALSTNRATRRADVAKAWPHPRSHSFTPNAMRAFLAPNRSGNLLAPVGRGRNAMRVRQTNAILAVLLAALAAGPVAAATVGERHLVAHEASAALRNASHSDDLRVTVNHTAWYAPRQ